ncbi:hypothetical protein ACLB2K_051805 [Fragaria x ananassa]
MATAKLLLTDLISVVDHVPSNYIRPISDRPNLADVQRRRRAPSLSLIFSASTAPTTDIIQQIAQACQNYGFFQVKNHGVPAEMIDGMLNIAREFFRLHCYPLEDYIHEWPSNPPSFREEVGEYCTSVRGLVLKLLEAISESLGLQKDYIVKALGKQAQHMALNYYPPCPEPELTYGLPGHTDGNLITILLQDDVPGLQVLRKGKWVAVNPIPNTFIINICDQMQVISNDRYKSVLHRAVVNCNKERISVPTFYCPSPDALIGPAKELVSHDQPAMYRNFTYAEFYSKFWDRGLPKQN